MASRTSRKPTDPDAPRRGEGGTSKDGDIGKVSAANEPRPPGRIAKEPEPVVSTGVKFRPGGDDFNRTSPVVSTLKPNAAGQLRGKLRPGGDDFNRTSPSRVGEQERLYKLANPAGSSKAKKQSSTGPHASSTARSHANRHARFNRTITDPTLKAWAKGGRAESRAKNKPKPKSTT